MFCEGSVEQFPDRFFFVEFSFENTFVGKIVGDASVEKPLAEVFPVFDLHRERVDDHTVFFFMDDEFNIEAVQFESLFVGSYGMPKRSAAYC